MSSRSSPSDSQPLFTRYDSAAEMCGHRSGSNDDHSLFDHVRPMELDEVSSRAKQMEQAMRWWSECTSNWREKWARVRNERNQYRNEIHSLEGTLEMAQAECTVFRRQLEVSEERCRELEFEIESLNRQRSVESAGGRYINGTLMKDTGCQCYISEQARSSWLYCDAEIQTEMLDDALSASNRALRTQVTDLQTQLKQEGVRRHVLEEQVVLRDRELNQWSEFCQQQKKQHVEAVDVKEQIRVLQVDKQKLAHEAEKKHEELTELRQIHTKAKKQLTHLSLDFEEAKTRAILFEEEAEKLKDRVAELKTALDKAEEEVEKANRNAVRVLTANTELEVQLEALQGRVEQLTRNRKNSNRRKSVGDEEL